MMTCRIQIEDGEVLDSFEGWGLIFIDSDTRTAPPEKGRARTSYIGEPGEHEDPRTVDDAFDYWVDFAISTPNSDLQNANAKIAAFNEAIRERLEGETDPDDPESSVRLTENVKRCRTLTLYNDRMRVRVTGTPELIAEPKDFYRRQDKSRMDCVEIRLNIRVTDPRLCDWNLKDGKG